MRHTLEDVGIALLLLAVLLLALWLVAGLGHGG